MKSTTPRLCLMRLEERAVPAVATWNGGGPNANWSTATNWVGHIAPQSGDDLVFSGEARQLIAINDFPAGTAFRSLAVNALGYTLGGNAVNLTAGVTADTPVTTAINLPLGGTGGLTKSGPGTLELTAANTYAGATAVNAGTLEVRNGDALGTTGAGNGTTVGAGGALHINFSGLNVPEAVTLAGGTVLAATLLTQTVTLSGPLTLAGNAVVGGDNLTLAGGVSESGGPHELTLTGGTVVFPAGTVNAATGTVILNANVEFNGTGPFGAILAGGGSVSGGGSVGFVLIGSGRTIAPGPRNQAVGTLTVAGLTLSANVLPSAALFDFAAGGVDRLVVNGSVIVGGVLAPGYLPDFAPAPGARYRLIDNDGTDQVFGTFDRRPEGAVVGTFGAVTLRITYVGGTGNDVEVYADATSALQRFAVGAGAGGVPLVNVFDGSGSLVRSFFAYDQSFRGGVNVAVGDVTGDGVPDVVTGPGVGGGPDVRVWDGQTGALVRQLLAYDASFRGGVNVATSFVNPDGFADVVTGAGLGGGPHVRAFDGSTGGELVSFFAYDASFTGGVSVAGGKATTIIPFNVLIPGAIITGAGVGGGPHVRVFDAVTGAPTGESFFAYDAAFTGGINVAYDGFTQTIVTAPKAGGGPVVRGFSTAGALRYQFLAYDVDFRGGVSVAVQALGAPGGPSIVTGPGPGLPANVRVWNDNGNTLTRSFNAFDPTYQGGVFVG